MNRREHTDLGKSADKVAGNFRNFVDDAEALVRATANFSGEGLAAARAKVEDQIETARSLYEGATTYARDQTRKAVKTTDGYVHERPWQAIGAALAAGMLIGYLSRRS